MWLVLDHTSLSLTPGLMGSMSFQIKREFPTCIVKVRDCGVEDGEPKATLLQADNDLAVFAALQLNEDNSALNKNTHYKYNNAVY